MIKDFSRGVMKRTGACKMYFKSSNQSKKDSHTHTHKNEIIVLVTRGVLTRSCYCNLMLTPPIPIPDKEKKRLKDLKAFIKPFETPQRSVKIKI